MSVCCITCSIDISLDGFHTVCGQRLQDMISARQEEERLAKSDQDPEASNDDNLIHFTTPSLTHLIALLCRPTTSSIPPGTSLLVIDSLPALFNHAFPKSLEPRRPSKGK